MKGCREGSHGGKSGKKGDAGFKVVWEKKKGKECGVKRTWGREESRTQPTGKKGGEARASCSKGNSKSQVRKKDRVPPWMMGT